MEAIVKRAIIRHVESIISLSNQVPDLIDLSYVETYDSDCRRGDEVYARFNDGGYMNIAIDDDLNMVDQIIYAVTETHRRYTYQKDQLLSKLSEIEDSGELDDDEKDAVLQAIQVIKEKMEG